MHGRSIRDPRTGPAAILVLLALSHGLLYMLVIPPWQAPDEPAHFEAARLLAEHRRTLSRTDASPALESQIIESLVHYRAWSFAYRPAPAPLPTQLRRIRLFGSSQTLDRFSLSYLLFAAAVTPFMDARIEVQLYAMRAVSVLLGVVLVLLVYYAAREAVPDPPEAAFGAALVALFLPQHSFIFASVNDGNLAEVLVSAGFWLLVHGMRTRLTGKRAAGAILCFLAALVTKATAVTLLPLAIVLVGSYVRRRPARRTLKLLIAFIVLAAFSLLFLFNQQMLQYLRFRSGLVFDADWQRRVMEVLGEKGRWLRAVRGVDLNLTTLFKSFWMDFGWLALELPAYLYGVLAAWTLLAAVGWARIVRGATGTGRGIARIATASALSPLIAILALFIVSSSGESARQGRFLFISMGPLAILLAAGWLRLAPGRERGMLLALLCGLLALDGFSLMNTAVPFFYAVPFQPLP